MKIQTTTLIIIVAVAGGCQSVRTQHILDLKKQSAELMQTKQRLNDNLQIAVWGSDHNPDDAVRVNFRGVVYDIVGEPAPTGKRFAESATLGDVEYVRIESGELASTVQEQGKRFYKAQEAIASAHDSSTAWSAFFNRFWTAIIGFGALPLAFLLLRR